MNASVEALVAHRGHLSPGPATAIPESEWVVREGVLDVPGEVSLYHGGKLSNVHVAWRLVGPANAPVVCALGGISSNRRVFDLEEPRKGWWSEVVGPGQALDAERFRVLSFDYLGGGAETTGPGQAGAADTQGAIGFPNISTYDQAELLVRLLNNLGIKSVRAIVGGSYGGMVALAFGERYPERVSRLIVIGAPDRT